MKILKICVSIILSIILGISLSVLTGLLLIRNIISKDNLFNLITGTNDEVSYVVNESELAYVEADINNIDIDYNELENISKDNSKIHEILDSVFVEQGLPTELIDYIVVDTEYQEVLSEYLNDYLNYSTGNGEKPTIDTNRVNSILEKNIAKYEEKTNNTVDKEKITTIVTKASEKIDEQIDKITENSNIKPILNILFSKKLLIGLIINCIILATIIVIINMNIASTLIYLATALLVNSGVYTILSAFVKAYQEVSLEDITFVKNIINMLNTKFASTILISFIAGFIMMIVGIILKNVKKEKANN